MKKLILILMLSFLLVGCSGLERALDPSAYENCEVNTVLKVEANNVEITVNSKTLIDGDKVYSYTSMDGMNMHMYMLLKDEKYYMATQSTLLGVSTDWEVQEVITTEEIAKLEEEMTGIPELNADDFEKDEDGYYVMKQEKADQYFDEVFSDAKEFMGDASFDEFALKFKIENNKMSIMIFDIKFTIQDETATIHCQMNYSKFGDISFEIPKSVTDKM